MKAETLPYKKTRSLILASVFIPVFLLIGYIVYDNYCKTFERAQTDALRFLKGLSSSLSLAIDGDEHQWLTDTYTDKDAITSNTQDPKYQKIQSILKKAQDYNGLQSSVYTLVFDDKKGCYQFGVASSENPFFRHTYNNVPDILRSQFTSGGTIPCYVDDHGSWLSAFTPVYNKAGVAVAVVQADLRFDEFQSMMQAALLKEIIAVLLILTFSMFVMYRFIDKILKKENESKKIIETQNLEINQSIDYAKVILESAMNMQDNLKKFFPNSFIMFKPKDKVGGDFYFFCPLPDEDPNNPSKFYAGVFDCTGHGIPGAILSMLGLTSLSQIVHQYKGIQPDEVLKKLSKRIMYILNQKENENSIQDGMEGCLCLVDMNKMNIKLSSSYRKILYIKKSNPDQLDEIKGDRVPIGGIHHSFNRSFTLHNLDFEFGDKIILSTDGIVDQHTTYGEKQIRLTQKRLVEYFNQNNPESFTETCTQFSEYFESWKGELEQTDDATLMALELLPYSAVQSSAA